MAETEYPQATTDEVWEVRIQEGEDENWYVEEVTESEEEARRQLAEFIQDVKDEVLSGSNRTKRKRFSTDVSAEMDIEEEVDRLRKMYEAVRPKDVDEEAKKDYARPPYPRFRIVHRVTETKADLVYDESEGFPVEDASDEAVETPSSEK